VLNARIRKRWLRRPPVGVIGEKADLTYDYSISGAGPDSLKHVKAGHFDLRHAGRMQKPDDDRRAGRAGAPRRRGGAERGGEESG
jgi:hypothetical protein